MQTSPDADPSRVSVLSRNKTPLPWSLLIPAAVIVPCSALASTVLLGGTFTSLGVPVIIAFAVPLALQGGAVFAAWEGVRTDNKPTLLLRLRVTIIIGAVMALLGLLVAARNFSDPPTLFIALAMAFGAGPAVLAGLLDISGTRFEGTTGKSEPEQSQP
ncbi:hypothetical protein AB0A63_31460 [Lentzea sp. NPDC042327]|uniref:hypothetical protein n=1 Tax=Lentzea sp. NPDC042327 TaxID=3154801 RepID=UPI0033F95A9D